MDARKTRLAEVLAAYGADPARWPASERAGLEALTRAEPDLLADALQIDRILARAERPPVPEGAKAQLLARAAGAPRKVTVIPLDRVRTRPTPSIWSWGTAAALAASFAFGIFLGGNTSFGNFGTEDVVEIDDPIVLTGIDDAPDLLEGGG